MSTTQNIESFKGEGWSECSAFIQTVRAAAWKEGKLRDPSWMADFASIYFLDEALAWYCHLPQDVQESWPKLQAALVDRWSLSGDQCQPKTQNEPAAAAAPSPKGNEKKDYLERGILKAVVTGDNQPYYVHIKPGAKTCTLTEDAENALRFRFDSHASIKVLECIDRDPYSWLAIHWDQSDPNVGRGSVHWSQLTIVDSETLKSPAGNSGPLQFLTCRVSSSGEATCLWRNGNTETAMTLLSKGKGAGLYSVPDPEAYQMKYTSEKRLALFIQKVD